MNGTPTTISTNVEGIISSLDVQDFMLPLYEMLVNSIQAIEEKGICDSGDINIIINREKNGARGFAEPIESIIIRDNGAGFTNENYNSFLCAYSPKKINIGGKGVGRFTALAVFDSLSIQSIYLDNANKLRKRSFILKREDGLIADYTDEEAANEESTGSVITLFNINQAFRQETTTLTLDKIKDDLLHHCLLYYINGSKINITVSEGNTTLNLREYYDGDSVVNSHETYRLNQEEYYIYAIKNTKRSENICSLCANNRVVKNKRVTTFLPIFGKPITNEVETYHLSIFVVSSHLDRIVNHSRTDFKFPKNIEKDYNEPNSVSSLVITEDDVYNIVINFLHDKYNTSIKKWQDEQKNRIEQFINSDDGLEFRHITVSDSILNNLKGNATENDILKVLTETKIKRSSALRQKKDKLFKKNYSNDESYCTLMNEVLSLTDEESKSQLAQYVSHRNVIIRLMENMLAQHPNTSSREYALESALHNIIYTMGGNHNTMSYDEHNLWLLDDRLAYHRYIYSDTKCRRHAPIADITNSLKEPDIALYDIPFCYAEREEYGDIKNIVLFEFKRPGRTVNISDYLKQREEQIEAVSEEDIKDANGRHHRINGDTPVFFYYICDEPTYVNLKRKLIKGHGYLESPFNTLYSTTTNIHSEIITYNTILKNAKRRNRILFSKLGLPTNLY